MTLWRKLVFVFILLVIAAFIVGALWLSQLVVSFRSEVNYLAQLQSQITQPKDGYTPVKGVDYVDGKDGTNGLNSVSTNTTTIEHDQVTGPQGAAGAPARELYVQVNPITRDLEEQHAGDTFWTVLIPCAQLQIGCPYTIVQTLTPSIQSLGSFTSL